MSNNVREYQTDGKTLHLTATVYGDAVSRKGMQFTIGMEYATLTYQQLVDLKGVISRLLNGKITATGVEETGTVVDPKGRKTVTL